MVCCSMLKRKLLNYVRFSATLLDFCSIVDCFYSTHYFHNKYNRVELWQDRYVACRYALILMRL